MTDLDVILSYLAKQYLPPEVNDARKRLERVEEKAEPVVPEWQRRD